MHLRRVGEATAGPVFQRGYRTWYKADIDRVGAVLEDTIADVEIDWNAVYRGVGSSMMLTVAKLMESTLTDVAGHYRDLGLLFAMGGDWHGAHRAFSSAMDMKRTPADTWFHLGEAHYAAGDEVEACAAWGECVQRSRSKKSPTCVLAQSRLDANS